jgi:HJR/Mrr/RecB family endonuclease
LKDDVILYSVLFVLLFIAVLILAIIAERSYSKAKALKKMKNWFEEMNGNGDGTQFEDFLEEFFKRCGWKVKRPTSSTNAPDFGVDLILDGKIAVQAKNYSDPVGDAAVQAIFSGAQYWKKNGFPHLKYSVVVTTSSFTKAAKKQAESIGVIMKDGTDLREGLSVGFKKGWILK